MPDGLVRECGLAAITNLVVRHEFASGPVVALNAHGDTGPAGDGWTADPLGGEIKDGVLYGLGVLTKAALAVYAHALAALRDARPDLSGTEVAGILCNSSSRRHPARVRPGFIPVQALPAQDQDHQRIDRRHRPTGP